MESGKPLVSVVIPVYCHTQEHYQFLQETLQSVAAQNYRNFELVIVDDVSPINIIPLVESVDGLPETRILRNEVNLRQAESRNVGIRAARGELIAFLDHDDLWLPNKLSEQVAALKKNDDVAMVFCDMETFGPHADRLNIDQRIIPDKPGFYWFVSHGNFTISASAVMVKKWAMLDIGLFDSRYSTCDDFDAWLKILMHAPILHIPQKLAEYRLHDFNVNYGVDRLNDNILLTNLIMRYFKTAPAAIKLKLIPRLVRKYVGRVYFHFCRHRKL